jgi:hypothetical protein
LAVYYQKDDVPYHRKSQPSTLYLLMPTH